MFLSVLMVVVLDDWLCYYPFLNVLKFQKTKQVVRNGEEQNLGILIINFLGSTVSGGWRQTFRMIMSSLLCASEAAAAAALHFQAENSLNTCCTQRLWCNLFQFWSNIAAKNWAKMYYIRFARPPLSLTHSREDKCVYVCEQANI